MTSTKDKLMDASLRVVATQGIAKASARTIAAEAGVNQALVFYHFGSVEELLAAACDRGSRQRIDAHRAALAGVNDLDGLVAVARELHAQEAAAGNVAVLGQLLAGSSSHPSLAPATAAGIELWAKEVQMVLERLLGNGPLAGLVDVRGLSRAISAAFIGLELYDAVDPDGAGDAFDALEQLARFAALLDQLGPLERTALRRRLRRATA